MWGRRGQTGLLPLNGGKKWSLITMIREMIFLVQITGLVCKASF